MHPALKQLEAGLGEPLSGPLRAHLEHVFDADLSHVRIHRSATAAAILDTLGAVACTDGEHILFAEGRYRPDRKDGLWLLAHEIAHVVQKRRGQDAAVGAASSSVIELEAGLAAECALEGVPAGPMSGDSSPDLRCWGEGGHYYSIFYAAAAAGYSASDACLMATRAQLPDEVHEYDATHVGIAGGAVSLMTNPTDAVTVAIPELIRNQAEVPVPAGSISPAYRYARTIQRGLHCLSGHPVGEVVAARRAAVLRYKPSDFAFGLALHPFGDSYAHQNDNGRMFEGLLGHFHQKPVEGAAPDTHHHDDESDEALGKCVDFLHRRPERFREYLVSLYDTLCEADLNLPRRRSLDQVKTFVGAVLAPDVAGHKHGGKPEPKKNIRQVQIDRLRKEIADMLPAEGKNPGANLQYQPETEDPVFWGAYLKRRGADGTDPKLGNASIYRLAMLWDPDDYTIIDQAGRYLKRQFDEGVERLGREVNRGFQIPTGANFPSGFGR